MAKIVTTMLKFTSSQKNTNSINNEILNWDHLWDRQKFKRALVRTAERDAWKKNSLF